VEAVLREMLLGAELQELRKFSEAEGWNVSTDQLRRYARAALELIAGRMESDRARLLARHVLQRQALYAKAVRNYEWRTALAILDSEAELEGLQGPRRLEITGHIDYDLKRLTDAQLAALETLLASAQPAAIAAPDGGSSRALP
jgi:hypothetical protein